MTVCDPRKVRVKGRGIQPKGIRNGDDAIFYIHTRGAGPGTPEIKISKYCYNLFIVVVVYWHRLVVIDFFVD